MEDKEIPQILGILRKKVRDWPVPAIGHYTDTPYTVLISCILSLRTKDQTTTGASQRLFEIADSPQAMLEVPIQEIEKRIYPVSFYRVKAQTLHDISTLLIDRFEGEVPDNLDDLLTLPGVGRKTANIVVTLAFQKPGIAVDIHVHRISNRLGYVRTKSPDETEMSLRKKLPRRYWIELNDLFVAFGQNLCTPTSPHCSICPVEKYCDRVGVTRSR